MLPALKAREETAARRAAARRQWFAGKGTLEDAFPDLAQARLGSDSVIDGRLAWLDAAAAERAAERVVPVPAVGATRARTLAEALQKALDAEDAADDLERRFLVGLRVFNAAHPELSDTGLEALRSELDAAWGAADTAARSGPEQERAEASRRAAALDDERMRLERLVRDLRRLGTVPGEAAPSPADDIARTADSEAGRWAVERLRLLRPFVGEADGARIDAVVSVWTPVTEPGPASEEAAKAREEADAAVAAADAARIGMLEARDVRLAEVRESAALAHSRAASAVEEVRALGEKDAARRKELEETFGLTTMRAGTVKARLGFGQDEVDAAYADLRDLVETLRTETRTAEQEYSVRETVRVEAVRRAVEEAAAVRAARWEIRSEGNIAVRAERDAALSRWEAALDEEVRAQVRGVALARTHRDAVATMLLDARQARRALRPQISAAEWDRDRAEIWVETAAELELLGPSTVASFRERMRALRGVPRALLDVNVVIGFVRGSLLTILVALVWWLLRGRTDTMARTLLARLAKASPAIRQEDVAPIQPPLERLLRAAIDWGLGSFLVQPVGALVPELGFLLRAWMFVAGWRVAVSLYDVLLVRHPDTRFGLAALPSETWDLGRRTVRFLATWVVARGFARYVFLTVLGADVLDRVVRLGVDVAATAILVALLAQWEPALTRRMQRMQQDSGAVRFLAAGPPAAVLRPFFAAGSAAYLTAASTWALINQLASRQESLGQLLNVVTRYRLKGEAESPTERAPIPAELAKALQAEDPPATTRIERPQVDGLLWDAWTTWHACRRQGLVALVGDRGSGKRTAIDWFQKRVGEGFPVVRKRVARRLTSEADAMSWAAEAWGLPAVPDGAETLVHVLLELEPRVFVVEALEIAFLRTVNGFTALRALFYAANASAHRHFFVFAAHRPAWRYLSLLGGLVNTGVFATVIRIPNMTEEELQRMALGRLAVLGWSADFHGLVRSSPFGGDPDVELERAVGAYFRLLGEASAGNPAIALGMFAQCLAQSDRPRIAGVHMTRALELGVVEGLTAGDLFTLVALRTQDLLHLDEIVAVTNMAPSEVKTTVKHLEQRGLVAVAQGWVRVHEAETAAVTRTLRRRQFLQG